MCSSIAREWKSGYEIKSEEKNEIKDLKLSWEIKRGSNGLLEFPFCYLCNLGNHESDLLNKHFESFIRFNDFRYTDIAYSYDKSKGKKMFVRFYCFNSMSTLSVI